MRRWFAANAGAGWATCPVTESGFVRVSSNPKVLPSPIGAEDARGFLSRLRGAGAHRFVANDVSMIHPDLGRIAGHRRVTDAMLLAVARRHGLRLVTFDAAIAAGARTDDVEILRA